VALNSLSALRVFHKNNDCCKRGVTVGPGTVSKVERQERMWTLMHTSAYDDSLEAVAQESGRWLEPTPPVDHSSLGVVSIFRVSRNAFHQLLSSSSAAISDDGQFARSLPQIVLENEHSLMLSDPPVCVPGPLEQLLSIPPSMRDAGIVKAITIAISCLPFFQGFSPAVAAAVAAHMRSATVMTNHVLSLQGEEEFVLPGGQRAVSGPWGGSGCGASETLDAVEGRMVVMLVIRGCVSIRCDAMLYTLFVGVCCV
jgi:hypothetical protein